MVITRSLSTAIVMIVSEDMKAAAAGIVRTNLL